jgi:hypothetical protein
MNFQKKYFYTFKDIKNIQYTVEIWQDTLTAITVEEIRGDVKPFSIEYPSTGIFEPVKGSGCELNLVSTSDRKFFNLYTADMMEYQIKFYKSGVLIWCGYLDSELYSEPFNESKNYTVTFTGTDGFALLERLNYVNTDGSKFTGLSTQWTVLQNILNKLSLPYKNIFVGLSTTSSEFTLLSNETIFHKTYCNNQNWYNEDEEAETTRTVLESILQPYGAYIIQDNSNLYITDINTIAGATTTSFKKYDVSFNYVSTVSIDLNLGDLSTIKFADSSQQMNVISGFNKQVVKYSPYIDSNILKYTEVDKDFSGVYNINTFGTYPKQWQETIYFNSVTWTNSGIGTFAKETGLQDNKDESDYYLRYGGKYPTNDAIAGNLSFSLKASLPVFIPSNSKLKISCKAFARTIDDIYSTSTTDSIYQVKIRCRLKIGDKQYYRTQNFQEGWIASTDSRSLSLDFEEMAISSNGNYGDFTKLDNKWIDLRKARIKNKAVEYFDYLIPLDSGFTGGVMTFEIYDWDILAPYNAQQAINHNSIKDSVKEIRIKDLVLSVVDENNKEYSDSDIEYIGYMNQKFKNEGDEITLLQGTSKTDNPIEKAALMGYNTNYFYLKNWTKEGKTDCIENLLLRSIVSNYTNKRIELTASINQLNSIFGCVKYSNFISGKNLMVVGCTQDFEEATTSITIQEIVKDNLEINKSW